MAPRRRKSGLEGAIETLALLPWPVSLIAAVIAYFGFHTLAIHHPAPLHNLARVGANMNATLLMAFGKAFQYITPVILCVAAAVNFFSKKQRKTLLAEVSHRTKSAPLHDLSWRQFEQLAGAYFEQKGYAVTFTPSGPDGGVDAVARKGSETFLIQCKQWRATKVDVSVVRELFGVMAARRATGGYVVSIGEFTEEAKAFAKGRNIELVDAHALLKIQNPVKATTTSTPTPACPRCGAPMIARVAQRGLKAGESFYGCSNYPRCRAILPGDS